MKASYRIGVDVRLWNETGVGRYIRNLIKEITTLSPEYEFVFFALSKDIESIKSYITTPPSTHHVQNKQSGQNLTYQIVPADIRWHTLQEQLAFPKILEQQHLDLMHFPYFSVPVLYRKPYIVTIHDLILHHFPTGKASTLPKFVYWAKHVAYKWVLAHAVKHAKHILTVSDATKKEIIKHFSIADQKVTVTYEGIDAALVVKKHLHFDMTNPYFLYVGNAYPHKNLEQLLQAFKLLHEAAPEPVKLVLVGKEDFFYKRIKQMVSTLGLTSSVIFYDSVSDTNLSLLYKHAVAVVLPSIMEGFGLPAIEAMANGCVVVCANIPAFREICDDAAVYFNPTDSKDMFRVMEAIFYSHRPYIESKIARGKKRIALFSWKKMAQKTLKIYEDCNRI